MSDITKNLETVKHLTEKAKAALTRPDSDRIDYIRSPRWIGYSKAEQVMIKLEDLFSCPPRHRMRNMLLVGDTNNGKSMIINRFANKYPRDDNRRGESIIVPVLLIEVPPVPDENSLYNTILRNLNAPYKEKGDIDQKRVQVIEIPKRIGLRILILDELHNMLASDIRKQSGLRNAIRYLGNQLQIPIVGAGIKEVFQAIQSDDQLANRFEPVLLPRWEMSKDYLRLLNSFEMMLPLWMPSNLVETSLALKILSMSEGLIGEIATILEKAAIKAIKTREENINVNLLASIDWVLPSKRKELSAVV